MGTDSPQLDTRVQVITPENIAFQYRVAGPFRRLPAYLIDLAIRVATCLLTAIALLFLPRLIGLESLGFGVWLLILFVCTWFYGGVFETFWNGQTPGKRLMQIRVLSVDGQAINASQAVLRNVLRAADMIPGLYLVALVTASMNERFQRLGDMAAGTMVVIEEPHGLRGVASVNEPAVVKLTAEIPAWFQSDRTLARALALYVGRRLHFTPSRRLQIARYVGVPLREKLRLSHQTHLDHLLCALYNRTFVNEGEETSSAAISERGGETFDVGNPFMATVPAQPADGGLA